MISGIDKALQQLGRKLTAEEVKRGILPKERDLLDQLERKSA